MTSQFSLNSWRQSCSWFNQRLHAHLALLFFISHFSFRAQEVDFSSPFKPCLNWRPENPEKQWCLLPPVGSFLSPAWSWFSKDSKGWEEPPSEKVWGSWWPPLLSQSEEMRRGPWSCWSEAQQAWFRENTIVFLSDFILTSLPGKTDQVKSHSS